MSPAIANQESRDFAELYGSTREAPSSPEEAEAWARSIRRRLEERLEGKRAREEEGAR